MPPSPTFALVVPTLCEAQNLEPLLRRARQALASCGVPSEILVVDDDSCDGTEAVVNAIAAQDSTVRLLVRKGQRGLSGAILHGWQHTDATILGVMDADLQHPPELLPELLAESLRGTDLVIGSRYASGGRVGAWSIFRKLVSSSAVWATFPLQHRSLRVKDPMSGYFLVHRRCAEHVLFQQSGFKLLLEVLVRGRILSVREIPISFGRRRAGRSKAGFAVAWEYLRLLARLYAERWSVSRTVEVASGD